MNAFVRSRNSKNTAVGIRHDDHVATSIRKVSVGIVRSLTQDTEFFFYERRWV
jgi:hypothetical protein